MDENKLLKYIEKITLEIIDHSCCIFHQQSFHCVKRFRISGFNVRQAANAFLTQYNGKTLVKAQKISIWYNNEQVNLCVRDLIYGTVQEKSNNISDSIVEFIYRSGMFSEIKWSTVGHCSMIDIDKKSNENSSLYQNFQVLQPNVGIERLIIDQSRSLNYVTDNENHFRSSIYVYINQMENN